MKKVLLVLAVAAMLMSLMSVAYCATGNSRNLFWDFNGTDWTAATGGWQSAPWQDVDKVTVSDNLTVYPGLDSVLTLNWKGGEDPGVLAFQIGNYPSGPDSYKIFTISGEYRTTSQVSLQLCANCSTQTYALNGNNEWNCFTWTGIIRPNPACETLEWVIPGPCCCGIQALELRSLEVQTSCVPEPASVLAAFSILAPVGFVFRRRKA